MVFLLAEKRHKQKSGGAWDRALQAAGPAPGRGGSWCPKMHRTTEQRNTREEAGCAPTPGPRALDPGSWRGGARGGEAHAGRGGARSPPGPGLGGRPRPTGVCSFGFSPSKLGINIFKRPFIQGSNPSAAFSAFCFSHLVPKSKQQSLGLVPPSDRPPPQPSPVT